MKIFVILVLLSSLTLYQCKNHSSDPLPIMGNSKLVEKEINGKIVIDTIYHTIPEFSFTDQDGKPVTEKTLEGKIYVADFFFTTCTTICPVMKSHMLRVYEKYKDNDEVTILSHTIDPKYDNVAVLNKYAKKLGIESSEDWHMVTGDRDEIYEIARAYMTVAEEDSTAPDGFIHSGAFLLVDKEKRIRGHYDGTVEQEVDQLIKDIERLLDEY